MHLSGLRKCDHGFAMAHAPYLREKARQVRVERKLTIDELAERLALSRSTVYYWVRDSSSACVKTPTGMVASRLRPSWPTRLSYHADHDLEALRQFWAATLHIEGDRIRFQRKSNSNQSTGRTWRCRYGVLTVACHDTLLRSRMQAWMDCLRASWAVDSTHFGT
jgi:excisionase family DNA binding protein